MIMCSVKIASEIQLFVTETEFDRSISQLVKGAKNAKTIIFPNSIRENFGTAFSYTSVQSVVLNEKLEAIGFKTFCDSKIKRIVISKSVTRISDFAFHECEALRKVVFEEESKLEEMGWCCFWNSGL